MAADPQSAEHIARMMQVYRREPDGYLRFMTDWLDVKPEHVWDKMRDVAVSVHEHEATSVAAGHGVSKSFTAARLVLAFLLVHGPQASVISTAPGKTQVEEVLWRQVRVAYKKAKFPIGGELTKTKLDLGEDWFALGLATTPDAGTGEVSRFAGFHNKAVLMIFDEASGIDPAMWRSAAGILSSGFCRWLAIGNPLHIATEFHRTFSSPRWHNIRISVKDTPNYIEGREVIPGLSGRRFEQQIREQYGEDSNEYRVRVLGEFPTYTEGAFYGREMALLAAGNRLTEVPYVREAPVYCFWDIGDVYTAIVFVQFIEKQIRVIDSYYDSTGAGLPVYVEAVKEKHYNVAADAHWAGMDLWGSNSKNFQTGMATVDVAKSHGILFQPVSRHRFEDGITAVRTLFSQVWIDKGKNGDLVAALTNYRKKKNMVLSQPGKPAFMESEVKDWTNHLADAMRHMAMVYRYQDINGRRLGSVTASEETLLREMGLDTDAAREQGFYREYDPYERA